MSELQITGHQILPKGDLIAQNVRSLYEQSPNFEGDSYEIDLSEVENSDSAGLALLVYWYRQASDKNIGIAFKNCSESLLEIARLNGLERIFGSSE